MQNASEGNPLMHSGAFGHMRAIPHENSEKKCESKGWTDVECTNKKGKILNKIYKTSISIKYNKV